MRSILVGLAFIAGGLVLSSAHAESNVVEITLEQQRGTDDWEVRYELAEPVKTLVFERSPHDDLSSRHHTWRATEPQFELVLSDGQDIIRRKDGEVFDQASFLVTAHYTNITFDWPTFQPFSDDGLLIFIGRFFACPERCDDQTRIELSLSKYDGKPLIWDGDESFAFIGDTPIDRNPGFDAIVDRNLPGYLRTEIADAIPRLMAYYQDRLGALPEKPRIFVSQNNQKPKNRSDGFDGGTLGGRQLYLHFYGPSWHEERGDDILSLSWFFAHETAHLFQRPLYPPNNQAWVREGAADAMAALAVVDLEASSRQAFTDRIEDDLTYCAHKLDGRSPLIDHASVAEFGSHYKCGLIMYLAADAAMRRASQGEKNLFTLWWDFRDAVEAGAPADQSTMIDLIGKEAGQSTAAFLKKIIFEPLDDSETVLREGLAQSGYR